MGFEIINDSNEAGLLSGKRKVSFKEGNTYRLSFVAWPSKDGPADQIATSLDQINFAATRPLFGACNRVFINSVGFVKASPGVSYRQFTEKDPSISVATIVAQWPCDAKGNVLMEKIKEVEVLPYIFGKDKYNSIMNIHNETHMGEWDIKFTCTDSKYQKGSFAPAKGGVFATLAGKNSELARSILEKAVDAWSSLPDELGKELTINEIKEKLAGGTGGSRPTMGGSAAAGPDLEKMLEDL